MANTTIDGSSVYVVIGCCFCFLQHNYEGCLGSLIRFLLLTFLPLKAPLYMHALVQLCPLKLFWHTKALMWPASVIIVLFRTSFLFCTLTLLNKCTLSFLYFFSTLLAFDVYMFTSLMAMLSNSRPLFCLLNQASARDTQLIWRVGEKIQLPNAIYLISHSL